MRGRRRRRTNNYSLNTIYIFINYMNSIFHRSFVHRHHHSGVSLRCTPVDHSLYPLFFSFPVMPQMNSIFHRSFVHRHHHRSGVSLRCTPVDHSLYPLFFSFPVMPQMNSIFHRSFVHRHHHRRIAALYAR